MWLAGRHSLLDRGRKKTLEVERAVEVACCCTVDLPEVEAVVRAGVVVVYRIRLQVEHRTDWEEALVRRGRVGIFAVVVAVEVVVVAEVDHHPMTAVAVGAVGREVVGLVVAQMADQQLHFPLVSFAG